MAQRAANDSPIPTSTVAILGRTSLPVSIAVVVELLLHIAYDDSEAMSQLKKETIKDNDIVKYLFSLFKVELKKNI